MDAAAAGTPRADGFAVPPEWAPHAATIMAWPARRELWGPTLADAKRDYAEVANTIAGFEPVLMVARPEDSAEARAALTGAVVVLALPIDDSWVRDNGPIFLVDGRGGCAAATFAFNAWGEKFTPYDEDARLAARLCAHLGVRAYAAGMVLEGGAITLDGAGALVTTEQCLLHAGRNPGMSRDEIEARLRDFLGVERVVWLGRGLREDRDTDGHVDLIAACCAPREILVQGVEPGDPNAQDVAENVRRLSAAGFTVHLLDRLPRATVAGVEVAVPYLNLYVCNGAVIVPTCGDPYDPDALAAIGRTFAGCEVVPVAGAVLAYGGGGPHCITQQMPAA